MVTPRKLYEAMKSTFDYSAVLATAKRECQVDSDAEGERLLDAFLQWFSLLAVLEDGQRLQMIRSVDRIWHAFILNTRLYATFCEQFIGEFVHHDPLDVEDTSLPKEEYAAFTLQLLQESFGDDLNPSLLLLAEGTTCCVQKKCRTRVHALAAQELFESDVLHTS